MLFFGKLCFVPIADDDAGFEVEIVALRRRIAGIFRQGVKGGTNCFALGKGIGVQKDQAQAAAWYRKAAEQGYAPAQTMLGVMYFSGVGVPKDVDVGASWYCAAAAQGDSRARTNLEILRTYGLFDPQECQARLAR
mgnify:CR=1 FL=1